MDITRIFIVNTEIKERLLFSLVKNNILSLRTGINRWYFFLVIIIFLFTGCSYAPDVLKMIPESDSQYIYTDKSIKLEMITGGEETNLFKVSTIENNPFYKALEQSLIRSGLFRDVNSGDNPDYIIKAKILSHEKPFSLIDVKIRLLVLYQVINAIDGVEIWNKPIQSECKKTLNDEFVGFKREQRANECAAKENIRLFLQELSQLNL